MTQEEATARIDKLIYDLECEMDHICMPGLKYLIDKGTETFNRRTEDNPLPRSITETPAPPRPGLHSG